MSYSIFYRAMFIKLTDGTYIPMIESGDNNVWESNRRRARDWSSCRWAFETPERQKRYSLTEHEIMAGAKYLVNQKMSEYVGKEPVTGGDKYTIEDINRDFSYFSSIKINGHNVTTVQNFLSFFKSGFRNSVTFKELDEYNCNVRLSWWENTINKSFTVSNEENLAITWHECLKKGIVPYIGLDIYAEDVWFAIKLRNSLHTKPKQQKDEYYIVSLIYNGSKEYLYKLSSKRIWYVKDSANAKKYSTKSSALGATKRIDGKYKNITSIEVERIKKQP